MIRKVSSGYEILDGHHRYTAYNIAGVNKFPVQIVPPREIKISTEVPNEG
jgi:hypothetical protein